MATKSKVKENHENLQGSTGGATITPPKKVSANTAPDLASEGKKLAVVQAFLHSQILFQGITSDNLREAQHAGLKMVWAPGEGLLLKYNGHEAIIPAAGVKIAIFEAKGNGRVVTN